MPSGLTPLALAEAEEADAEALAELERICQSHPWTERHFRDALRGRARVLVLRRPWPLSEPRRGIVGCCVMETVADEAHVHNLTVEPHSRRRGLGRWLLAEALHLATRAGARTAWLEVRASNAAALALYAASGFRPAARRRDYYQSPPEDAVVLSRALLR